MTRINLEKTEQSHTTVSLNVGLLMIVSELLNEALQYCLVLV